MNKFLFGVAAMGLGCLSSFGGTDIQVNGRTVNVFAHRGGRHEFEENTMSAFRASHDAGIRGYETDVRLTKDGVAVISHDDTVKRCYGVDARVEDMTLDEIRKLRTVKGGNPMPTLSEFCEFLSDKPGMYVEFEMKTSNAVVYPEEKLETYCRTLHDMALARKPADSVYVFTSFDVRSLKKMGELFPESERMYIVGRGLDAKQMDEAKKMGIKRIAAVNDATTARAVREAKKAGFRVSLWPGSTLEQMRLSIALGADDACTDIPVMVLKEMGDK